MLVGKNTKHIWYLWEWKNLEEMQDSPVRSLYSFSPEGGVCFLKNGDKAVAGVYYRLSGGREILQFYDKIYLLNMEDSTDDPEEVFETKFEYIEDDIEYIYFTVDRELDCDDDAEYSALMSYFMRTYIPDYEKNEKIFFIFNYITKKSLTTVPADLFKIEPSQQTHQHHFDMYAASFSEIEEQRKNKKTILDKIYRYLKNVKD